MIDLRGFGKLKPGDAVQVWRGGTFIGAASVTRITKTLVVVGSRRFRKCDGFGAGIDHEYWLRDPLDAITTGT